MKTTKRLTTGELKKCTNCKRKRDTSLFNFSKASRDGLQSWCRPCLAEAAKEYYWKNPEKHRAYANSRQKIFEKLNESLIQCDSTNTCISLVNVIVSSCNDGLFEHDVLVNYFLALVNSDIKK